MKRCRRCTRPARDDDHEYCCWACQLGVSHVTGHTMGCDVRAEKSSL